VLLVCGAPVPGGGSWCQPGTGGRASSAVVDWRAQGHRAGRRWVGGSVGAVEGPGWPGEVGDSDERVVAPGREQLALSAAVAGDPAHGQALAPVEALGDVGVAVGVVDALPRPPGDPLSAADPPMPADPRLRGRTGAR